MAERASGIPAASLQQEAPSVVDLVQAIAGLQDQIDDLASAVEAHQRTLSAHGRAIVDNAAKLQNLEKAITAATDSRVTQ